MSGAAAAKTAPQVLWYGERGVINAVLTHITGRSNATASVQLLLSAVLWANGEMPAWVQTLSGVTFVVEVGLADFGDPDLMLVCHTPEGIKLIFVEAKVVAYADSMQSHAPRPAGAWGMAQMGFNSSINGQLTLKYRFAKALSRCDRNSRVIAESPSIFDAYQVKLNDAAGKAPGRTLAKPSVIDRILKPLQLCGLPETSCFYVTLTWDVSAHAYFRSPEVPKDCLPVFLDDAGLDNFGASSDRIGWIGYRSLIDVLGLKQAPEFLHAFSTMLDAPEPPTSYYAQSRKGRWNTFPAHVTKLASDIAAEFGGRALWNPGSYSVKDENGQTFAKIIPNDDSVFVGIRSEHPASTSVGNWGAFGNRIVKRNVIRVGFTGVTVRQKTEADAFVGLVLRILRTAPAEGENDSAPIDAT